MKPPSKKPEKCIQEVIDLLGQASNADHYVVYVGVGNYELDTEMVVMEDISLWSSACLADECFCRTLNKLREGN